jgi:YVTN family beta-propeller protein
VAVNQLVNKIYVANLASNNVTAIDGSTNDAWTVMDVNALAPTAVAVNLATDKIYVANRDVNDTVITEQKVYRVPIRVKIHPLSHDRTHEPTPTFTFTATDTFKPQATKIDGLRFQVDTWQGKWHSARKQRSGCFQGKIRKPLQKGIHTLYAYATDGQDATSTNTGQQSSPLIGNIQAYVFLVH